MIDDPWAHQHFFNDLPKFGCKRRQGSEKGIHSLLPAYLGCSAAKSLRLRLDFCWDHSGWFTPSQLYLGKSRNRALSSCNPWIPPKYLTQHRHPHNGGKSTGTRKTLMKRPESRGFGSTWKFSFYFFCVVRTRGYRYRYPFQH